MSEVDQGRLLSNHVPSSPVNALQHTQSTSSRSKRQTQARLSLRPNLTSIKNRLSMVLTPAELLTSAHAQDHAPAEYANEITSDPYWRPLPYNLDESERRVIHFVRSQTDTIELATDDRTLYTTNLPASHKVSQEAMPDYVQLIQVKQHSQARLRRDMNATICKKDGELMVSLQGLDPITFYRAKADCFRPVNCFLARRSADKTAWRTTTTCFAGPIGSNSPGMNIVSITYAWKNTSIEGKGGLKLVDLRDSEILAYYTPGRGKSLGKVTLQGSGLVSQRIVLATILALKYKKLLKNVESVMPPPPVALDVASFAETSVSETPTACDQGQVQSQTMTPADTSPA